MSREKTARGSGHIADDALAPFLRSDLDPADYLNATLPSLSISSASSRPLKSGNAVPLADLFTQTQHLVSLLNAHATRLSATLTQLTDDILRSGGRLAYQVEVLRGDTAGLTEMFTGELRHDLARFAPSGLSFEAGQPVEEASAHALSSAPQHEDDSPAAHMSELRMLATVRARLESVVKVFGEAMQWTVPPSEVSLGASLISVSAPEPDADNVSREERGKEFAAAIRAEIAHLVTGGSDGGVEKAEVRIRALQDLASVWKGTAEEKARTRFVDSLIKLAEDKQREMEKEKEKSRERGKRMVNENNVPEPAQQGQQQRSGSFLDHLLR